MNVVGVFYEKNKVIVTLIIIMLLGCYLHFQNTKLKINIYEIADSDIPKNFI